MKGLTDRQKSVLNFIKSYIIKQKYPPTVREIADHFNISVKGSHDHLKALQRKQYIRCNGNRSRAIEIIGKNKQPNDSRILQVPVLGNVAAGKPLFSEENYDGSVEIPRVYVGSGDFFALNVQGDSMVDAGIHDGDIAIIRQQNTADNGEIVVAMVNDAFTLKRFFKEKNRIKLQPENSAFSAIYPKKVRILGKMAYLIRNYGS